MDSVSSCLLDRIRNEMPATFFNLFIDAVFRIYRETYNEVFNSYDFPEAIDLLPYVRRAKIEGELRRIAQGYGELDAVYEKNTAQNSWHTMLYSKTKGVALTISATKGPREMVRDARFRETLAKTNQLKLFYSSQNDIGGTSLYGIIIHGADELDPSRPAFIRLGFPSRDCIEWVENFDLLKFCGMEYSQYMTPEENIQEEVLPVLRPQVKKQQK